MTGLLDHSKMKVGIIGAGISGLAAAYELSKRGVNVTVFEKAPNAGGICSSFKVGDNALLERYYHHFFSNDEHLLQMMGELGLKDRVLMYGTKMGFYCGGEVRRFSTPLDLLRFMPLSPLDRIRLGMVLAYFQLRRDWRSLDDISAAEWLERHAGKEAFRKIWEPLLRIKFGDACSDVSAAWVWGRVHERGSSRGKNRMDERLGYIAGGYETLIGGLVEAIRKSQGEVRCGCEVVGIAREGGKVTCSTSDGGRHSFDKVVSTVETPTFLKIARGLPGEYALRLGQIRYRGVVCATLVLGRPLSDFYWINVSEPEVGVGGVIEQTNFVPKSRYGGLDLVYAVNYVDDKNPLRGRTDEEIVEAYAGDLGRMFPGFRREDIVRHYVFRDMYATPVYSRGFSRLKPGYATPLGGVYIANTTQVYPHGRNLNTLIGNAKQAVEAMLA
jgi:protoporphyrinogen oxidase